MENQRNYQQLFRTESAKTARAPFVGLIMGPYDQRLPTEQSAAMWFNVSDVGFPMQLDPVYVSGFDV